MQVEVVQWVVWCYPSFLQVRSSYRNGRHVVYGSNTEYEVKSCVRHHVGSWFTNYFRFVVRCSWLIVKVVKVGIMTTIDRSSSLFSLFFCCSSSSRLLASFATRNQPWKRCWSYRQITISHSSFYYSYHVSGNKCKNRLVIHVDDQTVLTFPDILAHVIVVVAT